MSAKIQKNEREVSYRIYVNLSMFDKDVNIQIEPTFNHYSNDFIIPRDESYIYEHGHIAFSQDVDDEKLVIENTLEALKDYRDECHDNVKRFQNYMDTIDLFIEENTK